MTTWKGLHSYRDNMIKDQRKDNNFFPQTNSSDEKLEALRQGASLAWSSTLTILYEILRIIQRVMQSVSLDLFCQGLFFCNSMFMDDGSDENIFNTFCSNLQHVSLQFN
jgi:hypothetical protein